MLDHRFVVLGHLEVDDVALGAGEGGWFGVVAVYADREDVAKWCVGCFHGDVAGCLYCGGVDFLPVDGPAGGFEEFVEEDSLCAGVAVSEWVQDELRIFRSDATQHGRPAQASIAGFQQVPV